MRITYLQVMKNSTNSKRIYFVERHYIVLCLFLTLLKSGAFIKIRKKLKTDEQSQNL